MNARPARYSRPGVPRARAAARRPLDRPRVRRRPRPRARERPAAPAERLRPHQARRRAGRARRLPRRGRRARRPRPRPRPRRRAARRPSRSRGRCGPGDRRLFTDEHRTPVDPESVADAVAPPPRAGRRRALPPGRPRAAQPPRARPAASRAPSACPRTASCRDARRSTPGPTARARRRLARLEPRARRELGWEPRPLDEATARAGRAGPSRPTARAAGHAEGQRQAAERRARRRP